MTFQSTIRAFQGTLANFHFKDEQRDFPEEFAVKRFLKKFEVPDLKASALRKQKCWEDWINSDQSLSRVTTASFLLVPVLYKARADLHRFRSQIKFNTWDLPKGSEYFPTAGQNSIESRLNRSRWSCTHDNFERFARFVYSCKAMKRAFRKRYEQWFSRSSFIESRLYTDKLLYKRFSSISDNPTWDCFLWKLSQITEFTQGSRFTTVPKNNLVDRPINVEPIGNLVVQRQIGNYIRSELKRLYAVDLDNLAEKHREMIKSKGVSMIDLKNASDSITNTLCQFLFQKAFFSELQNSRSPYVLGLDQAFHSTHKISSMGNGYTFELMTLILTSIVRQFDPNGSVFGDDIIIADEHAQDLIALLEGIGFVVNKEKTFVNSPFRESCGSNYHEEYGYIESYDFKYPVTIHDCVVLYNKALRLSRKYPTFEELRLKLRRHIPKVLQGVTEPFFFSQKIDHVYADDSPLQLSNFFRCSDSGFKPDSKLKLALETLALKLCYDVKSLRFVTGFAYCPKLRSPTRRSLERCHWAKYEMYLHSGMVSKDILVGGGHWVSCLYVCIDGAPSRWTENYLRS